jgi:IS5 family transposase
MRAFIVLAESILKHAESAFRARRLVCGITKRSSTVMRSRDCLASQKTAPSSRMLLMSMLEATYGRRRMMLMLGVV